MSDAGSPVTLKGRKSLKKSESFALSPRALLSKTKSRTPSGLADDPPSAPAGLEDDESEEENEVDYRANYQQLLSQVMSDLRDLDGEQVSIKRNLAKVLPKERNAHHSFLRVEHLRGIPPRANAGPSPRLVISQGVQPHWIKGYPMDPPVTLDLVDANDIPIMAWAANVEVKAVLINDGDDWLQERYDGRSIVLGSKDWLEGNKAVFEELRVMEVSQRHKGCKFRLGFFMPEYNVEPVISQPFVIDQGPSQRDRSLYMYEREEEIKVDFAVPAGGVRAAPPSNGEASPLHVAVSKGSKALASLLLSMGDDVNNAAQNGLTPLHMVCFLNHLDLISLLLEKGADVDQESEGGFTPLHYASLAGNLDAVNLLLAANAATDIKSADGWTALHLAARTGDRTLVEILINHGAPFDDTSDDGQTPLHVAAFHGHIGVIETLLRRGASASIVAEDGWSLTHQAVAGGSVDALETVIEAGSSLTAVYEIDGLTPLMICAANGLQTMTQTILSHHVAVGASLSVAPFWTAGHFAASSGDASLVQMLIDAEVPMVTKAGDEPLSALRVAHDFVRADCVRTLLPLFPNEHLPTVADNAALLAAAAAAAGPKSKKTGFKRGDAVSWEGVVAALEAGDPEELVDVTATLARDHKLSANDCTQLVKHGVVPPLHSVIDHNSLNNQAVHQALDIVHHFASTKGVSEDMAGAPGIVPDLVAFVDAARVAVQTIEALRGNPQFDASFQRAAGQKSLAELAEVLKTAVKMSGSSAGGASSRAAADDSPVNAALSSPGLTAKSSPRHERPPSPKKRADKVSFSGDGERANARASPVRGARPGSATGTVNVATSSDDGHAIDTLIGSLEKLKHIGVLVVGQSAAGRDLVMKKFFGGNVPRAQALGMSGCGAIMHYTQGDQAGKVSLLMEDTSMDPKSPTHPEAFQHAIQCAMSANGTRNGAATVPVTVVWYCVEGMAIKMSKSERAYLTSLAEIVPVVVVFTDAAIDPTATRSLEKAVASVTPPLPFFEMVQIAPGPRAAEQMPSTVDGLAALSQATTRAVGEWEKMTAARRTERTDAPTPRSIKEKQRRSADFIASCIVGVSAVASAGIPVSHIAHSLASVGVPMLRGLSFIYGDAIDSATVTQMWNNLHGGSNNQSHQFVRVIVRAADKSNQGTSINEATAKTMMTALGLAFVKVATAIETDEESPLDADSARALVVAIGDEYEETISQGAAAVDAEFTKVRSGSFEP